MAGIGIWKSWLAHINRKNTDIATSLPSSSSQGTDPIAYLTSAGLHPLLAAVMGAPPGGEGVPQLLLLRAWALLLGQLAGVCREGGGRLDVR